MFKTEHSFILSWLIQLLVMIHVGQSTNDTSSMLTQLDDCTCLGHNQTFECVVFGAGITIWQGTAFHSPCVIRLRHSQYKSHDQAIGECNNGAIIARSIGVSENHFTSQLSIMVRQDMNNETVECLHQNIDSVSSIIGRKWLEITTAVYDPPPSGVSVDINKPNILVLSWNAVSIHCSTLQYIIIAMNCGLCPNTTIDTNITCILVNVPNDSICTIAVQAEICGGLVGNMGVTVPVLTVPLTLDQKGGSNSTTVIPGLRFHKDYESTTSNLTAVIAPVSLLTIAAVIILLFIIFGALIVKRKQSTQFSRHTTNIYEAAGVCLNTNHQGSPSDDNYEGIYSLLQQSDDTDKLSKSDHNGAVVYVDIGPNSSQCPHQINTCSSDDDRVKYSSIVYQPVNSKKDSHSPTDDCSSLDNNIPPDLNNLVYQIGSKVAPKWYQLGTMVGVDREILERCSNCPPEEAIVEVFDYWIRNSKPSWENVAGMLNDIGLWKLSKCLVKNDMETEFESDKDVESVQQPPPLPPKAIY